ncbi:hypothetical protein F5Y09DRAFT_297941 [Xylaria sp. FL1042]|nr:hypothetical protein F5Y09DRAFT_297941 [Xylaria sp. FL1042]
MDKGIQTWAAELSESSWRRNNSHSSLTTRTLHSPVYLFFLFYTEVYLFSSVFFDFEQVVTMAVVKTPYTDYLDNWLKYELIAELSPGVWKISRKSDRMEYLAQDITDVLFTNVDDEDQTLTDYGHLLGPEGEDLMGQVKRVLNHPNLVSLVDFFALQSASSGRLSGKKWFTVWDYCDAGNLANLLVAPKPPLQDNTFLLESSRRSSPRKKSEDGDTEMEDASSASRIEEDSKFLPESFCWHLLTSVLRALAWLHDGVRDVVLEGNVWKRLYEDLDWSPMLHRAITPENIFIGHPRRREWYGPVRLGNYGRVFVSGHCQAAGEKHAPTFSKVISPHPSQDFIRLENLIHADTMYGSIYPLQPSQPYTIVSEYRALGEIIQAMMIEPTGSEHIQKIQSQAARVNLRDTNYTGRLKNFVVKLMEVDPWQPEGRSSSYVTSDLYREALEGAQRFRATGREGADAYVTSEMAEIEDYAEREALRNSQLFDSFENVKEILGKVTPS